MKRLMLVAPGLQPVPPTGWGAVELLVDQLRAVARDAGYSASISNTRSRVIAAAQALSRRPGIVHVHWEAFIPRWRHLVGSRGVVIATTHSSRVHRAQWTGSLQYLLDADGHIALTDRIAASIRRQGYRGPIAVVGNGVNVSAFVTSANASNGRALCLGRIEPRKRQVELSRLAVRYGLQLDFVGPGDASSLELSSAVRYLGKWSRQQVCANLGKYSVLVLASDGEADPLVAKEALASGVPVVLSTEAAALPVSAAVAVEEFGSRFIHAAAEYCRGDSPVLRREARQLAINEFDWSVVGRRYVEAIEKVDLSCRGKST